MALKSLKLKNRKEEFLYYYNQKLSDREIGEKMGVFRKTIGKYRQSLNLPPNKKFPLSLLKDSFIELYKMGLSDAQIANKLGFSRGGISKYRSILGLATNNIISENDKIIIRDLEDLNYNKNTINILIGQTSTESNIEKVTDREKAILIGILLGDGNIYKRENSTKNASFSTSHSPNQKLYSIHIATILMGLGARLYFAQSKTLDKRNNKYYESYIVRLKPSKFFNNLYNIFYKNGIKIIPDYIYDYYTSESLAYQYMDDGNKICGTYKIATNCFNVSELQKFQYFLLTKFNLKTTLHKDNGIYIRKESANTFKELVSPYIIDSMKYKLY